MYRYDSKINVSILCNAAYLSLPHWPKDKVNARIERPIREAPLRIMSPLLNAEEFNESTLGKTSTKNKLASSKMRKLKS